MKLSKCTVRKILTYGISNSHLPQYLRKHFPRLYKQICEQTSFLDEYYGDHKIGILERLYCIEHNLLDIPFCQKCKTRHVSSFFGFRYEYSKWCCASCQASDSTCIKKSKDTRKKKYGDENFNNHKKSKETISKKCHNDPQYWSKRVRKAKNTKKAKYGNENYTNVEKMKQTLNQHINENPNFWIDRERKSQITKIERYGDPTWNNRDAYHKTCIEHFGVDSYSKTDEWKMQVKQTIANDESFYDRRNEKTRQTIKSIPNFYENRNEKSKKTCNNRYGVNTWLQTKDCYNRKLKSIVQQKLDELTACEYDQPLFSFEFLLKHNLNKQFRYQFRCSQCGKIFTTKLNLTHGRHYHCPNCFPREKSKCERAILEFIKTIYPNIDDIYYHDRKTISPLELDILITNQLGKIAIEYNGIYWHSIDCKDSIDKYYHFNKSMLCEEKNICLISIFEDEWLFQPQIVKDKISKALGICTHINANDCTIVSNQSKIQLAINDEIVASLHFCKSRLNINEEWEFMSYETKNGIVVDNGLKRLTNEFEKIYDPSSIVSFIDRSYSNEQDFLNAGFVRDSICKPRLWWYNKRNLIEKYHNAQFKKDIAPMILGETFVNSQNQIERLVKGYWLRLYDCGLTKVVKRIH